MDVIGNFVVFLSWTIVVAAGVALYFWLTPNAWKPFKNKVGFGSHLFIHNLGGDFTSAQVKNFYNPTTGHLNIIADNGTVSRNFKVRFSSFVAPERISLEIIGEQLHVRVAKTDGGNVTFKVKKVAPPKQVDVVSSSSD